MEERSEVINKLRAWHLHHTQGALTQHQPKFWVIFWITAAIGLALYYVTAEYRTHHLGQDSRFLLSVSCLSLPLLVLRRLHLHAFILLGISLMSVLL